MGKKSYFFGFVWNRSYIDVLINLGLSVSLLVLNSIIDVEDSVSFLSRTFYPPGSKSEALQLGVQLNFLIFY